MAVCLGLAGALQLVPAEEGLEAAIWLISIGLVVTAVGILLWALRNRIVNRPSTWDRACPQCGGSHLKRIHRHVWQVVPSWVGIPVRRYLCDDCGWKGLRIDETRI